MKTRSNTTSKICVPLWLLATIALVAPGSARAQQASHAPIEVALNVLSDASTATATDSKPAQEAAPVGDPYGFTAWLNSTRASYGLAPVGYDPNLTNWAHMNNTHQNAYGMGHHVMGPASRQNSAMGNYASVPGMWMNSPAHRAALLDPTIRWIGIAGLGAYWTFNAY